MNVSESQATQIINESTKALEELKNHSDINNEIDFDVKYALNNVDFDNYQNPKDSQEFFSGWNSKNKANNHIGLYLSSEEASKKDKQNCNDEFGFTNCIDFQNDIVQFNSDILPNRNLKNNQQPSKAQIEIQNNLLKLKKMNQDIMKETDDRDVENFKPSIDYKRNTNHRQPPRQNKLRVEPFMFSDCADLRESILDNCMKRTKNDPIGVRGFHNDPIVTTNDFYVNQKGLKQTTTNDENQKVFIIPTTKKINARYTEKKDQQIEPVLSTNQVKFKEKKDNLNDDNYFIVEDKKGDGIKQQNNWKLFICDNQTPKTQVKKHTDEQFYIKNNLPKNNLAKIEEKPSFDKSVQDQLKRFRQKNYILQNSGITENNSPRCRIKEKKVDDNQMKNIAMLETITPKNKEKVNRVDDYLIKIPTVKRADTSKHKRMLSENQCTKNFGKSEMNVPKYIKKLEDSTVRNQTVYQICNAAQDRGFSRASKNYNSKFREHTESTKIAYGEITNEKGTQNRSMNEVNSDSSKKLRLDTKMIVKRKDFNITFRNSNEYLPNTNNKVPFTHSYQDNYEKHKEKIIYGGITAFSDDKVITTNNFMQNVKRIKNAFQYRKFQEEQKQQKKTLDVKEWKTLGYLRKNCAEKVQKSVKNSQLIKRSVRTSKNSNINDKEQDSYINKINEANGGIPVEYLSKTQAAINTRKNIHVNRNTRLTCISGDENTLPLKAFKDNFTGREVNTNEEIELENTKTKITPKNKKFRFLNNSDYNPKLKINETSILRQANNPIFNSYGL